MPMRFIGRACAVAAGSLVAFGARAGVPITTWELHGSDLQYVETNDGAVGGPFWEDYPTITPGVGASQLPEGLKVFGTGDVGEVFTIDGATYIPSQSPRGELRGNRLIIYGGATFDGSRWTTDHAIRTQFDFGFFFDGGLIDFYETSTSFTLLDGTGQFLVGVGSGLVGGVGAHPPGGYGFSFAFLDGFGSNFATATQMLWQITLGFEWLDYSIDDTFTLTIPNNSIDMQVIPAPGAVALGLMGLAAMAHRRRR